MSSETKGVEKTMKICFYADLYWILNFIINLFILNMTAYLSQTQYRRFRWCVVSALCSTISLTYTYYSHMVFGRQAAVLSFAELIVMLYMAYRPYSIRVYIRQILYCMEIIFITAGFLMMIRNILMGIFIKHSHMSLLMIVAGIFILAIVFHCLRNNMLKDEMRRKSVDYALIVDRGKRYNIKVLYDTGNHLISPYTGEPVMIISGKFAKKAQLYEKNAVLIPYHSIGGDGLLNAYRLDFMKIGDRDIRRDFLAAVSDELFTDKDIQMILNIT